MRVVMGLLICLAAATQPAYEPTSAYELRDVEGWNVYVHRRLLEQKPQVAQEALDLLTAKLRELKRTVPKKAIEPLSGVKIWIEAHSKDVVGACYHPSRRWLEEHNFNPDKAKSIEIGRPENFINWSKHQPWMVMHELAHAYHHQVLGYNHPEIRSAYQRARESGSYDQVLLYNGKRVRHYAMNNDQEYFAEATEAFFGTNDFYPFVRAELKEHDPQMHDLLRRIWGEP